MGGEAGAGKPEMGAGYGLNVAEQELDALVSSPDATRADYLEAIEQLRQEVARARISEIHHQAIFEYANDAIILLRDGVFVDCNPKALEMFGCSRDEFVGRSPAEFSPPLQADGVSSGSRAAERIGLALAGQPQRFEWRHCRADGTVFEAEVSLNRVDLPSGLRLHAIVRDVTARKREADALRFFQFATNSSLDIVAAVDRDYNYLFANHAYCEWHHTSPAIRGQPFAEIVGDEAFAALKPHLDRCLAGDTVRFEVTHPDPARGIRYLEASYFPLRRDSGDIIGVVSIARDITREKEAEAILEYEAGFRKILGDVARDLISLPPDAIHQGINRALGATAEFIGADRAGLVNFDVDEGWIQTTHAWQRAGFEPREAQIDDGSLRSFDDVITPLMALEPVTISNINDLPDGPTRAAFVARGVVSVALIPVVSESRCVGAVGFEFVRGVRRFPHEAVSLLEVTSATLSSALDRKRADEQKAALEERLRQSQKMEAIGRLAGGVAHDFNNMLCVIMGNAELMLVSVGQHDVNTEVIEEIRDAATRAADLTRQLLAFSRKQLVEARVMDINSAVEGMQSMLGRLIGEQIRLHVIPGRPLARIRADPGQIEQVILNLVVNARDAMPDGGDLSIETAEVILDDAHAKSHDPVGSGVYVMLAVSDTGQGMSRETRARVFEPFFTTKELGQGTGLGLATVYGIVEQHRGRIEVYSELGQGTCIKVYFPRVDDQVKASSGPVPQAVSPAGQETVLVVEDEDLVRGLARRMLERLGYTVLVAASGPEAIELVEAHQGPPIDLLVTDVVMPMMNGRELAEQLQARFASLEVLFTSGYTQNVIAQHGVLDEDVHFLPKPYSLQLLAERVRRVLDGGDSPQ